MNIDLNKKSREQIVNSPEFAQEVERLLNAESIRNSEKINSMLSAPLIMAVSGIPFSVLNLDLSSYRSVLVGQFEWLPVKTIGRLMQVIMTSEEVRKGYDNETYSDIMGSCVWVYEMCVESIRKCEQQAIKNIETRQKLTV